MRLKEVNINSLIVIYLVVAKFKELSFCFSSYLVAKDLVIHRLMGDRLVKPSGKSSPKTGLPYMALFASGMKELLVGTSFHALLLQERFILYNSFSDTGTGPFLSEFAANSRKAAD
jgi:hypothetical protein